MRKIYFFVFLLFVSGNIWGQYSLVGAAYSQNFNGLGTGSSTVTGGDLNLVVGSGGTLNGWYFSEADAFANTTITADNGVTITGDTYNYGTLLAADRTLGGLLSDNLNTTFGFWFINNTGATITSLEISYTGEQWRLGSTGRFDGLNFQYSYNATSLIAGTWSDFNPLDCTAPTTSGAAGPLDGNLAINQAAVSNTISGLSIANGTTFFIRWQDLNGNGADDGLGIDDLVLTPGFTPASTDYFRSAASGNWGVITTWEQSTNNITWVAATSVPTPAANTITIRSGHTVTIAALASADQLVIESGAILNHFSGSFTIADGTGYDVTIQSGGVFVLSSSVSGPGFASGSTIAKVSTGGILRVSAGGLTGAGTGVNASNYVYEHQSILEWTLGTGNSFSTAGVTYFPNVLPDTIPIFRTTNATPIIVGAASNTTFNGVFQCNGNTVTWQNAGFKIFRNGITGSGNVEADNLINFSGKFVINGSEAKLGGTGVVILPNSGGLEIGSGSLVFMTTPGKTLTGNVTLLPNTYIQLEDFVLTVSGTITGGAANAYIRNSATGIGFLRLNSVTSKTFPIGYATYNPIVISNGGGFDYYARVNDGINPSAGLFTTYGINRTWHVKASTAGNTMIAFQYEASHLNPGVTTSDLLEILMYSGLAWSIIEQNRPQVNIGGTTYVTTSTAIIPVSTSEKPLILAKTGGWILPLDCIINCRSRKLNNTGIISWDVNTCAEVNSFEVQRSINGTAYQTIATITPATQLDYSYTDAALAKGTNLYRIKVNRSSGAIKYSNTVAIINDTKGILITALSPNPVNDKAALIINAAKAGRVSFTIYDVMGKPVKQWQTTITEGSNIITVNARELPGGIYHLAATTTDSKTVIRFVKQ